MTHEFSRKDFAFVLAFALGCASTLGLILSFQQFGVFLLALPSETQIFAYCSLAAGIGLASHHIWKYGFALHPRVLDHGFYAAVLIAVGMAALLV